MLFLLLRILNISISKDIVSYKDRRKDNKYKYRSPTVVMRVIEKTQRSSQKQNKVGRWKLGPT